MAPTGFDTLMQFYQIPPQKHNSIYLDSELQEVLLLDFTPYTVTGNWGMLNIAASRFAHPGHTATCPGFYGPQSRTTRLHLRHSLLDVLAVAPPARASPSPTSRMETAGIFALGTLLGHCTASISLVVANRVTGQVTSNAEAEMEALIEDVISLL